VILLFLPQILTYLEYPEFNYHP